MNWRNLRIAIIGPMPPPAGGMGDQVQQLSELMRREGASVTVVRTNPPCRIHGIDRIGGLRTLARLVTYFAALAKAARANDLFHVMANSGWSWHLLAAPAIWLARVRTLPCVVSYHGGEAESFLARAPRLVTPSLRAANALIVPSRFLQRVFAARGIESRIVPNVVDLSLFRSADGKATQAPRLVVARNLEPLYDIPTALRAFALVRERFPDATLSVAGSGSQLNVLRALAHELGIAAGVRFTGRLTREQMATLLAGSDLMLNSSTADNMPVSILEAMASGVPIVSARVGGIPYLLEDGRTGLLVEARDADAMGRAALRLLSDPTLAERIREAARASVQRYSWQQVRPSVERVYGDVLARARPASP